MTNYFKTLLKKYRDILNSDNPFIDGYYGQLHIVNYLGDGKFLVWYFKCNFDDLTEEIMTPVELRNYEG